MDLDDLRAIAEKERGGGEGRPDPLLHGGGLPLVRVEGRHRGAGGGHRPGRPGREGPGRRGRLHAPLLRGPAGPGRSRRPALREGHAGPTPPAIVAALDGGAATAAAGRPEPPVLRAADGRRAREQRPGRARPDRVVHRGRRLPVPLPRAPRDEPGGGRRGDHPQRPARPGRGGLPDGREVGHGRQAAGRAQVRRLQRRRGRPRRLHGPQRPGERPAPRPGGDGHRRLRGRGEPGLHLRPRRVSHWRSAAWRPPSSRPSGSACSAARSSSRPSTSGSTSGSAPGPSSAARRRP